MRSIIFLGLLMFTLVVGVGYSINWYMQSRALVALVEDSLAQINKEQPYITYESIETSGFPNELNISIINPNFKGRIDQILQKNNIDNAQNLSKWDENIALNGSITFGVDIFASHFLFTISGDTLNTSNIGNKTYKLHTTTASDMVCQLQLDNSLGLFETLWDFGVLDSGPKDLMQKLRLLDCNSQGYTVTNHDTGDTILTGGTSRIFVSSEPIEGSPDYRKQRFYIQTDSEVLPQGDTILMAYIQALSPASPVQPNFSVHGKKVLDMDLTYDGPLDITQIARNIPVDIQLNKLNMSSNVHHSNTNFRYSNHMEGNKRDMSFTFESESTFEKGYNTLLQETVHGMIMQLYSPYAPQPADIQPLIRKYRADELYQMISPAIPDMFSLGQLTQSVNVKYQGAPDFSDGNLTFTHLNLSTSPYGLKGKGAIQFSPQQPFPAANIALSCNNCPRMVDDVANYVARLRHAMSVLADQQPSTISSFELYQPDGFKIFLSKVADAHPKPAKEKNTFLYSIVSNGFTGININGKQLDEIMKLYTEHVGNADQTSPLSLQ